MKHDINNWTMRWKPHTVPCVVPKFHELWSTNGLEPERSFYVLSLFPFVTVHRTPCGPVCSINVATHSDSR